MEFYDVVEVIHTEGFYEDYSILQLLLLNGVHNSESKYGIAEYGGYYEISEEEANEILERGYISEYVSSQTEPNMEGLE